jgi:hypothetical protein
MDVICTLPDCCSSTALLAYNCITPCGRGGVHELISTHRLEAFNGTKKGLAIVSGFGVWGLGPHESHCHNTMVVVHRGLIQRKEWAGFQDLGNQGFKKLACLLIAFHYEVDQIATQSADMALFCKD